MYYSTATKYVEPIKVKTRIEKIIQYVCNNAADHFGDKRWLDLAGSLEVKINASLSRSVGRFVAVHKTKTPNMFKQDGTTAHAVIDIQANVIEYIYFQRVLEVSDFDQMICDADDWMLDLMIHELVHAFLFFTSNPDGIGHHNGFYKYENKLRDLLGFKTAKKNRFVKIENSDLYQDWREWITKGLGDYKTPSRLARKMCYARTVEMKEFPFPLYCEEMPFPMNMNHNGVEPTPSNVVPIVKKPKYNDVVKAAQETDQSMIRKMADDMSIDNPAIMEMLDDIINKFDL